MSIFEQITPVRYWVATAAILAAIGATMTMPDSVEETLPGQITQQESSDFVSRIGRVVDIIESTNITVEISGSPTLVTASYLFPQYEPLIGDLVYVTKQDAQWFVHGTMSGPLNTVVPNPDFEEGIIGSTPTGWSISSVLTTAGTLIFTKEELSTVSGRYIGVIRNSSAGTPGISSSDIFSSSAPADAGQRWTVGYFISYAVPDVNASLESQGGFMDLAAHLQFLDPDGILVSETLASYIPIYSSVLAPYYVRTFTSTNAVFVVAPPGTALVRLRIRVRMTMHVNSASEIGLDTVLMRSV